MREINVESAADYLRQSGHIPSEADVEVRELSGGVSNIVLRVDVPGREPFVIKQCRERLRVAMEWHARLERIWAERATLELLGSILTEGTVPDVLFVDRPNFLFAMTCAPDDATAWKTRLMAGEVDPLVADNLGTLLGMIHARSAAYPILHGELADTSLFDELRVDPYYRTTARANPELSPWFNSLIDSMAQLPVKERTLVLGDFSPKNILVHSKGLILLDFECAHRGDPTFDLGFILSHLILKSIHLGTNGVERTSTYLSLTSRFWAAYLRSIGESPAFGEKLVHRAIAHTVACLLARVDGKSPVEYLEETNRRITRALAIELLRSQPATWDEVLERIQAR